MTTQNTTVAVSVSDEIVNQLFLSFVGLSPVRQEAVRAEMKNRKISIQQATLEEIFYPRVEIYAKRGEEVQEAKMQEAVLIMRARGFSQEKIDAFFAPESAV